LKPDKGVYKMSEDSKKTITICMGSSCFSRGNNTNLKVIQEYLKENELDTEIHLQGALCRGMCRKGPVIFLNDEIHTQVEPADLPDLLSQFYREK